MRDIEKLALELIKEDYNIYFAIGELGRHTEVEAFDVDNLMIDLYNDFCEIITEVTTTEVKEVYNSIENDIYNFIVEVLKEDFNKCL